MTDNINSGIPSRVALALEHADCAGPASEELIRTVERNLGLTVPQSYRAFLRNFGAALLDGFEIYGLIEGTEDDAPPMWSDLRNVFRTQAISGAGLIPISDDGGDYTFYLTTQETESAAKNSVVVYGPGRDGPQVCADFFSFIEQAAREGVSSLISK